MSKPADARNPLQRLAALLTRLPGIGEKTALRLALFLVAGGNDGIRFR